MRRFILLTFIGVLSVANATVSSKNREYPSRLKWLFRSKSKYTQEENKEENKPIVCQSQECKKIAQRISESMDKTVDPCDDFYEYACGKWPENNPVPKGMRSWNMLTSVRENVGKKIQEIFDEGPKNDDPLPVKLAKKWYAACMDTDSMEKQGLDPIVFTLSRIGGWPLIMEPDEWNEQEYSWQKVDDQYVRLMGMNAFHDVRVQINYHLNYTRSVHLHTPHLPPGSYRLWGAIDSEEEDTDDEDLSDEEKQSNEQDSQEPGSEDNDKSSNNGNHDNEDDNNDDDKDDNNDDDKDNDEDDENDINEQEDSQEPGSEDKSDNNDNHDNEDDNNEEDKNDDNDTNEQNNDDNAKKRVGVKKTGKIVKNKKLKHNNKKKSSTHLKKHENHKTKKDRIKRRTILTNIREKLREWKNERNNVKQERIERLKKTLEATTPQSSTRETIDEDDELKKYANYISKVAHAIAEVGNVKISEEHMDKDIQDMIKFHMKLVSIVIKHSIRENKEITLDEFQEWYNGKESKTPNSKVDWEYKIGELFDEAHVPIGGDLDLETTVLDYFEGLLALLDETSSRTIVNYIHWNFLSRVIRTTTSEMRKLYDAWKETEDDNDEEDDLDVSLKLTCVNCYHIRSRKCTQEINMHDIAAYEFVRNHFSDKIKATASDMIDDMQKEVEYQIKKSDWMDEDTKDFVLSKLVNMDKFIGYPVWYKNNTIVKQYFQGLIIGKSYYENMLSFNRYSKWKSLRKLLEEDEDDDDDDEVMISPLIVNAFFSPRHNIIAFSAADFQSPMFAYDRPQVINYGIIGAMMGHEVNHGFDNRGRKYDKKGRVVKWLSAMVEAYGKRAECFVEQYNNYTIDKALNNKINNYGNLTAGENIADTMGLEAAFKAYQKRERACGKSNIVLPGHEDLTNDQLFFLSFANLCCEAARNKSTNDVHSVPRLRVIGSVSNLQEFAEAYNCPVGSAMNPEKKCHIWK